MEARRNLSARGNNTQIRRARCGRMRYKKRVRQGRHRLARQDHQTDKRSCGVANAWTQDKTQQLGADFVNMRQAIYSTERSNKMKYHLEPRESERVSYVDDASAFWPDVPPLPPPPCDAEEALKAF